MSGPASTPLAAAPAGQTAPQRSLLGRVSKLWPLLPAILFLGVFFAFPISTLLYLSFFDDSGAASLVNYQRLVSDDVYIKVLLITLKTAGWTTVFALIGAYPVAYLLATVKGSTRNSLAVWVLMPLWTSFLVRAFAWMVLLGRNGAINDLLMALGIVDMPLRMIYNFTGVMVGMVHCMLPLCVMTMLPTMENIDSNLVKAASTLGARRGEAFWRIYFPLSMPGVAAGGLLVFITSLGFFITPALLGGAGETMIVQLIIFQVNQMLNWGFAGAIAVLFLVTTLVIFFFYDQLVGLSTLSGSAHTGKRGIIGRLGAWLGNRVLGVLAVTCATVGRLLDAILPRPSQQKAPRAVSRGVLWFTALLVIVFLCVPAFFVVPVSFTQEAFLNWPPKGFTLKWYDMVFASHEWLAAIGRSFLIGILSAVCGMLIGVPVSFFIARNQFAGKSAVLAFVLSPIIIPHIIIAVSLFYLFSQISLVGTLTGMVIGHTVLTIPYVVITVMSVLKNYDVRLDQAAWTLGANRLKTLRYITLPIIRSGMIAAFMFAFIISFDELTIALFVTGGEVTTLPKMMWDDALLKVSPVLAAVASLLLLFMTALILLSEYFQRRGKRRAR